MAKSERADPRPTAPRYEFRVWGRHKRTQKLLAQLAEEETTEQFEDCYLLTDETHVNVKIRNRRLKVKQLVERSQGFERWESTRYGRADADAVPAQFDDFFEALHRAREQHGKSFDLAKAVARLDERLDGRVVLVTKDRRRYRIGSMRAEVTDVTFGRTGNVLRTIAIEGDDLEELVRLRDRLGLDGARNVSLHRAIEADL